MTRKTVLPALGLLAAMTLLGGAASRDNARGVSREALDEYAQILSTAQDWSVNGAGADRLVYASIQGMVSTLDPHTTFFEPGAFASLEERQRGSYFGVGISMQRREGRITIMEVKPGTPAGKAGLRAGDVITEIDGQPTEPSWDTPEVSSRVRGPKGSTVRLAVRRAGIAQPIRVTLVRGEIPSSSVRHAFLLGDGVGYIQLAEFTRTSADDTIKAVRTLKAQGMKRLLLDLRGNPGGALEPALEISDMFLGKGQKIVSTRGRMPASNQDYRAEGRAEHYDGPLVVLVNRGSASASEILAGAIQDHDRGWIVGTTSWGKGLVQGVFPLSYGAGLALTTARYLTPSGRWIQRDYSDRAAYLFPDANPPAAGTPPADTRTFSTDAGRPVRAEGGITPDETVAVEAATEFERRLQAQGAFFTFAVDYVAAHPAIGKDFTSSDAVREEFFRSVERQKIQSAGEAREDYRRDSARIDADLVTEVLTLRYGADEGWKRALRNDVQAQKALQAFPEAIRIARLPKASPSREAAQLSPRAI
ncbi:MAG: S41 family peptidase [Thermoanaerobaculia bacterium]